MVIGRHSSRGATSRGWALSNQHRASSGGGGSAPFTSRAIHMKRPHLWEAPLGHSPQHPTTAILPLATPLNTPPPRSGSRAVIIHTHLRAVPPHFEELGQVVELAVDVPACSSSSSSGHDATGPAGGSEAQLAVQDRPTGRGRQATGLEEPASGARAPTLASEWRQRLADCSWPSGRARAHRW